MTGDWVAAAIIGTVTCVAFLPVLWNQFVEWDDYENLVIIRTTEARAEVTFVECLRRFTCIATMEGQALATDGRLNDAIAEFLAIVGLKPDFA